MVFGLKNDDRMGGYSSGRYTRDLLGQKVLVDGADKLVNNPVVSGVAGMMGMGSTLDGVKKATSIAKQVYDKTFETIERQRK
jgi:hypothetical protein